MKELGIDIETYSSASLPDCGVYRYVEAPDFALLLFGYSVDGGQVRCIDIASGEHLPSDVLHALTDPSVTKTAYNATFERICIGRWLGTEGRLDPAQWRCTMARAARLGLPLPLAQCAEALRIEQGKMAEGKALIRYFSMPGRDGKRHMPCDAPDKWETFKAYNVRDVEVEQAVLRKVRRLAVPEAEEELYTADQEISDRGVMIDRTLVENAARFDREYKEELTRRAQKLTGLENPNSPVQLKAWIKERTGITVDTLGKSAMAEVEGRLSMWRDVREMLGIRKELGKTSNRKYEAMLDCVCADGRIHGLLQYYGAARTGRWAGRLVQVQNLPQNHLTDLDEARSCVRRGDLDEFESAYSVTQTLSELIRTAFIAKPGSTFHVCDFSAIEARVIAWLAGETWVLDVFRAGRDIYCETASKMFGVPVEKHGINAGLRQKGKVAVLALGYGGGTAALEAMGGGRMGLTESEEKDIVLKWRKANPRIVRLWDVAEKAATSAICTGRAVEMHCGIRAERQWGMLTLTLPSGRALCYPRARVETEDTGDWRGEHSSIVYEGVSQTTKKWGDVRTYGGKLTENLVQAIARDILASVLLKARRRGLDVVFHIHDEIIVEARPGQTLADVEALFSEPPAWCRDLPLKGAGYTTPYYMKD